MERLSGTVVRETGIPREMLVYAHFYDNKFRAKTHDICYWAEFCYPVLQTWRTFALSVYNKDLNAQLFRSGRHFCLIT